MLRMCNVAPEIGDLYTYIYVNKRLSIIVLSVIFTIP